MLKLRKKLLSASLAAVVAVSASAVPVWSEAEPVAAASSEDTAAAEGVIAEEGNFVTEEQAFSTMELACQNSKAALYVDKDNIVKTMEGSGLRLRQSGQLRKKAAVTKHLKVICSPPPFIL